MAEDTKTKYYKYEDTECDNDWMHEDIPMNSFTPIDRDEEDENILKFQETGDVKILEKVYLNRVQTLEIWASKFHYLAESSEDMFSELIQVFLKAVNGYKKKRKGVNKGKTIWLSTPFNTYLWYSLTNYIRNIKNSKRAKKRRAIGYNGPLNGMVLSLDLPYRDKEGSEMSLKDVVSNDLNMSVHHDNDSMHLKETLAIMSKDNPTMYNFLIKLSGGHSLTSAIKDCKTISGKIKLNNQQIQKLKALRRYNKMVTNLIMDKHKINKPFKIVEYSVNNNFLHYSIEMHKTQETDFIMKMVRQLKKNKEYYNTII